ncbi:hypothetical protein FSARC_1715 [Fusarium sarcochroum]|uniref:Pyruvate decarboxylase n=1 Tax=Fusarium sarcochroum TaxID=1208366 RepID=A0A8H4U8G4_9HYPO|nr:hypothetical protein FSARC_1715 [Fusarium sarcochroum]
MSTLTVAALSQLNEQMSDLSVSAPMPQPDMDDCSSECSYYSLADLEKDKWYRRIPASQVRKQAKLVPEVPVSPRVKYPRQFFNKESLPLKVPGPWKEYPLCLNKEYISGNPGPARIILNPSSPDGHDVVYHPTPFDKKALLANYRPKGYGKGVIPKPTATYAPAPVQSPQNLDTGLYQYQQQFFGEIRASVFVADVVPEKIYQSKQPFILVDVGASRYGIVTDVNNLVQATGFPMATTPFGKGAVDETVPKFHGVYGTVGDHVFTDWVKDCDLVLYIVPFDTNVNAYYYKTIPEPSKTINWKLRQYIEYPKVLPNLPALLKSLPSVQRAGPLLQATFWKRLLNFFEPGDIIMTETGTPSIGGRDFVLPRQTTLINSGGWLSIGYMLGASQGATLAQRDLAAEDPSRRGRTILFEGDGSFQMTAQELSTIIHMRLDMIIFLINNDGYTIERLVQGENAVYNDIAPWNILKPQASLGRRRMGLTTL